MKITTTRLILLYLIICAILIGGKAWNTRMWLDDPNEKTILRHSTYPHQIHSFKI